MSRKLKFIVFYFSNKIIKKKIVKEIIKRCPFLLYTHFKQNHLKTTFVHSSKPHLIIIFFLLQLFSDIAMVLNVILKLKLLLQQQSFLLYLKIFKKILNNDIKKFFFFFFVKYKKRWSYFIVQIFSSFSCWKLYG